MLAEAGHDVTVLDDFSLSSPRNLFDAPRFDFVRGDVRDAEPVGRALDGADAVIHLAAITGARRTHEMREETFDVNVGGTETVIAAAEENGVERIVLASSCNVYGDVDDTEIGEDAEPAPPNPYAESKLEAERLCREADLDIVMLRLATNYGMSPGVRFNLVVNKFSFMASMGESPTVYGDGRNWRPFLNVGDTARAMESALDWPPGTYNVGTSNHRIEEIARRVTEIVGRTVDVGYLGDEDPGPSYHVAFDRMEELGFEPDRGLDDGIRTIADRFRDGDTAADAEETSEGGGAS